MSYMLEARAASVTQATVGKVRQPAVLALAALLALTTILNVVSGHSSTPTATYFAPDFARSMSQGFGLLALIVGAVVVALHIYTRRSWPRHLLFIWAFFGALALSDFMGAQRGVSLSLLITTITTTALFLLASSQKDVGLTAGIRNVLLGYLLLNLLSIVVLPAFALQRDYDGGLSLRLHGLANHANSLAPYALLLLCTLVLKPYAYQHWNALITVLALVIIAATQSKTTIILLAILLLFGLPHAARRLNAQIRLSVGLALVPLILAGLTYALIISGSLDVLLSNDDVVSLTGRDVVWRAALDAWRQNPVFGYGYSALWSEDMRQSFATLYGWQPRYSHNLWVQVLGQAGYVGLTALTILLANLFLYAARASKGTRLFLVGMLVTFFGLRGISEVPIGGTILSDNTIFQLIVMLLVFYPSIQEQT